MSKFAIVCTLLIASSAIAKNWGYKPTVHHSPFKFESPVQASEIPEAINWGNVNGVDFLTQVKNQHIPEYCGSCWAQGTTSSLSDRISIMRNAAFPEININVQTILDCDQGNGDNGCSGGNHMTAFEFMHKHGITDETCNPYKATSYFEGGSKCTKFSMCKECNPGNDCYIPKGFKTYYVDQYYEVKSDTLTAEQAIMAEIASRGPVACGVNANPLEDYVPGTVLNSDSKGGINHIISLVGYGATKDGEKYWILRNSWGEYWGNGGYAFIRRGNNTIRIEESCAAAIPKNTWDIKDNKSLETAALQARGLAAKAEKEVVHDKVLPTENSGILDQVREAIFPAPKRHIDGLKDTESLGPEEMVVSARPENYLSDVDVPENFWWGDVSGTNYLSWTVDQHLPQYCGSCWAQAALSALADRHNIATKNLDRVAFSVQRILNCKPGGASCHGGQLFSVYQFGVHNDIVEMGCQVYQAFSPPGDIQKCDGMAKCKNCSPGNNPITNGPCIAQPTYAKWRVKEYGRVVGPSAMKKEILARGPIVCGMHVTNKFENYTGGIYSERLLFNIPNHAISVVGWGVENGTEYWMVRNSWGTRFGIDGYFKINMHDGDLGIGENSCYWAISEKTN